MRAQQYIDDVNGFDACTLEVSLGTRTRGHDGIHFLVRVRIAFDPAARDLFGTLGFAERIEPSPTRAISMLMAHGELCDGLTGCGTQ